MGVPKIRKAKCAVCCKPHPPGTKGDGTWCDDCQTAVSASINALRSLFPHRPLPAELIDERIGLYSPPALAGQPIPYVRLQ